MTIKQQGGIFGRNPSFNNADVETLDVTNVNQDGPTVMNLSAGTVAIDIDTNISSSEGNVSIVKAKTVNDRYATIDLVRLGSSKTGLAFYTTNAGTLQEAATFNDVGNLAFPSGQGIDFSATSGTGTSELFSDYEEGTWTPTYVPASGSFSSVTYDPNTDGRYTKIGNTVYISGSLRTDAISVGTASGQVFIGGLPFSVGAYNYDGGGFTTFQSALFAGEMPASANPTPSGTTAALLYRTAADGALSAETQVSDLGTGANNNILRFFGFYFV